MASGQADFDDDDDFKEYNPHPYSGGYDIALTYGSPLPASPAICYPLSSATSPPPQPPLAEEAKPAPTPRSPQPQPSLAEEAKPAPTPGSPQPAAAAAAPVPVPEPEPEPEPERPPPYDYGTQGSYQPQPYFPDIFRSWLFGEEGHRNPLGRCLDYLFGHAQGYGERRIGVDRYGIPIYASKKQGSHPISVQVEPASAQRLDFYVVHGDEETHESWSSSYGERKEENYGYSNSVYAYDRHYYEQPLSVQVSPNQHKVLEEQVYHDQYSSSYDQGSFVTDLFGSLSYGYERHYHEQPLHVQIEPIEQTWSQKLSYHDDYQQSASPKSTWGDEGHIVRDPNYAYERHSYEQTHDDQLEPFMPSWSRNLGYNELYGEEVSHKSNWHSSLFGEQGDEDNISSNPNHAYERHHHEDPLSLQLEPFKPAWSQNPSYYKVYEEEVPSISNWGNNSENNDFQFFSPF